MNRLQTLEKFDQSVWLDYIRRSSIVSHELERLISEDGLKGVTSNPAIFEKAIGGSTDYDTAIRSLEQEQDRDAMSLYEQLAIEDIQSTADILKPIYQSTNRRDGYVSLEVSPYLANDTEQTILEARRLWQAVDRENLMVKVPATDAGIPAIKQLISEGININVTLLFDRKYYERVAEAYISGLESLVQAGGDASRVASVASFFISRIDVSVDNLIDSKLSETKDPDQIALLKSLKGKVAIANAKLTYQGSQKLYQSDRWQALAKQGAQPQRLLWASTGTKNPEYSDVLYVEELIGSNTVNTVPPATLTNFREHGNSRSSLTENVEQAQGIIDNLGQVGISLTEITDNLLDQAVNSFSEAFDKLLSTVEKKREVVLGEELDSLSYNLPPDLEQKIFASLDDWRQSGKIRRLWDRDSSLWTNEDENQWLSWLCTTEDQLGHIDRLQKLAAEVKQEFDYILLLGMGGSSLCPEVMKMTFGRVAGFPELLILDSTDSAQIKSVEAKIDLAKTLFIVSSKSGSTLEPNIFKQYFFERLSKVVGAEAAGRQFIAVTDPGSKLQKIAEQDNFRHIFYGIASIGGRYSALSNFGMVPGAAMGVDMPKFLDITEEMVHSCAPSVPAEDNPGVVLGTILGVLANEGRDKITLVTSPGIGDMGAWLEQLLAESTGKQGRGLIPVDLEPLGEPEVYGNDRLFVYLRLTPTPDPMQDAAMEKLAQAGHPTVCIAVKDRYHIGQEFFRWEVATAVAGSIIGINAFNQPDVEASKIVTKELTTAYESTGALPPQSPIFTDSEIKLYTDDKNAAFLNDQVSDQDLAQYLQAHLSRLGAGDYFALLAYIEMNHPHQEKLQAIRKSIRDRFKVATCLGFGPRFLHSTGQAYKGGPNTGVFLQITCDDALDLPVPQQKYNFGIVKAAQARGDFQVLVDRDRRALRVHLGQDVDAGLTRLQEAMKQI
ncbi:MAG: bifunctional transaldolase/phosoglucose isomerase [Cyanobacteria bacterium P01_A01_bin.83]